MQRMRNIHNRITPDNFAETLIPAPRLCLGSDMDTMRKNARGPFSTSGCFSTSGKTGKSRAVQFLVACSLTAALASCSAGSGSSAGSGGSAGAADEPPSSTPAPAEPASPTTSPDADMDALQDPLADKPLGTTPARTVVSEKGTGNGTYQVKGGLAPGQTVLVTVSCRPGSRAAVTATTTPLIDSNFPCSNKSQSSYTSAPAPESLPEFTVTITTDEETPYWLGIRVADAQ